MLRKKSSQTIDGLNCPCLGSTRAVFDFERGKTLSWWPLCENANILPAEGREEQNFAITLLA